MLKAGSHSADLKSQFTILLAGGAYSGPGSLGYHNGDKLATGEPVSLGLVSSVGAKSDILFRLHGLFMLCAWVGCAGAGMIMARYFKQTWKVRAFRTYFALKVFLLSSRENRFFV